MVEKESINTLIAMDYSLSVCECRVENGITLLYGLPQLQGAMKCAARLTLRTNHEATAPPPSGGVGGREKAGVLFVPLRVSSLKRSTAGVFAVPLKIKSGRRLNQ